MPQNLTLPLKQSPHKSPGTEPLLCSHLCLQMEESSQDAKPVVQQPLKSQKTLFPCLFSPQHPPIWIASTFPRCTTPWQRAPPYPEPTSLPIPRAWHSASWCLHLKLDTPASGQLQFFPFQFQFLLIFEALISEMYGIIGLYCLAIYLCLSLCAGLILFSTKSQKKMLPLLLFGYHNSSRSPELLGSAAPRNFVLR